ncbi:MAG: hydroxyacylglutathione hydrolase [Oceanospirillaceae bacterium]
MFQTTPIPAFADNYIWMLHDHTDGVVVVDPGDAKAVIDQLDKSKKSLNAILITHFHDDHTGGVDELVQKFQVPVYGPQKCKFPNITHPLADGDSLQVFNTTLKVKAVPGHTLDHICYVLDDADDDLVFCGDTLFLAGCGRVFEGTMQQMLSAMDFFKHLPETTKVYCTHEYSLSNLAFAQAVEPDNSAITEQIEHCKNLRALGQPTLPTNIAQELLTNPFLRCDKENVRYGAHQFCNRELSNQLDVFTALRKWKNIF